MQRPAFQRIGKVTFATIMAVVLAVPAPLAACCRSAQKATCCHAAQKVATSELCGQPTAGCPHCQPAAPDTSTTYSPAKTFTACGCACCRPSDERNTPSNRTIDHSQPQLTLALGSVAFILDNADASAQLASSLTALTGATAVPHRILHCTWLI